MRSCQYAIFCGIRYQENGHALLLETFHDRIFEHNVQSVKTFVKLSPLYRVTICTASTIFQCLFGGIGGGSLQLTYFITKNVKQLYYNIKLM